MNGGDSPSQSRAEMGPGEFEMALSGCLSSLLELGTRMPLASFAYANEGLEGEDNTQGSTRPFWGLCWLE